MEPYSISDSEMFVNHQKNWRSGHMGHAMVDAGNGKIIDFYSNCDGERVEGHSGYGWMEYKVSTDYGKTFGPARILSYSRKVYEQGLHTALCEKAVCAPDGRLVLFFLINDATKEWVCDPWSEPTMVFSFDGGETFTDSIPTGMAAGRIYDAVCDGRSIYVIIEENEGFLGSKPEHVYNVYRSDDNGESWIPFLLPISAIQKGYGALGLYEDGSLVAYAYDADREKEPEYCISYDRGVTWTKPMRARCEKMIRNPQLARVGKQWFLTGRNGWMGDGLVLYHSNDGISWDEGQMLDIRPCEEGGGYYSNMLVIQEPGMSPRILLQYSHVYDKNRVNIMHRVITVNE
ncbi:MAG: exo-alpha-sialidase [Anaerotignum sp.]|nr:exo-alpha-sialidase [Anaerotignum sp.]